MYPHPSIHPSIQREKQVLTLMIWSSAPEAISVLWEETQALRTCSSCWRSRTFSTVQSPWGGSGVGWTQPVFMLNTSRLLSQPGEHSILTILLQYCRRQYYANPDTTTVLWNTVPYYSSTIEHIEHSTKLQAHLLTTSSHLLWL